MIKHIVMWRLYETAQGKDKASNAQMLKQKLEALRGQIPGLLAIEVGIDHSATADSSDVVLYSEFENAQALHDYHTHPLHLAVAPFVKEVRKDRRVVDYEV